jgi:hypothetical protein
VVKAVEVRHFGELWHYHDASKYTDLPIEAGFRRCGGGNHSRCTAAGGRSCQTGGPEVATLQRIITFVLMATGRRRRLIKVSFGRARTLAFVTEIIRKLSLGLFPEILTITSDQVKLLHSDNIVSPQAEAEGRTLRGLGIAPEPFETLVPSYLYRYRKTGQFAGTRAV